MRKRRCFLLLLSVMFVVLLAVTFFTWLGRVKGGEEAIRDAAKNEVDKFFFLYNKKDYNGIYDLSCDSFKVATVKKDFLVIMDDKMKILGEFNEKTIKYSNVINSTSVELYYRVEYANYSLIEIFNYIENDGQKLCLKAMYTDDSGKRGEVIKLH
ncbi:sugar tyrosine-protein kinase [Escherichia albertii]|nr:sugar tyrosine-protein kinase [Escherichia albertii]MCZ8849972.1 sugar tyrosine-protein kinase [Escherichia albertii]